ncbi:hypothetical protein Glove_180g111 [Diversispora epigaea]|uniref:Checkpoint protein n=1 Tax=Diversispora epigaea TaxID=1348612 RepID=A0A397IXN0_9GLOM|nr:hypothetical protein Glove_180g111 [Diversispora epigaea]
MIQINKPLLFYPNAVLFFLLGVAYLKFINNLIKDKNCYLTFTNTGIRITYQTRTIFEALYIDSVLEFPTDEDSEDDFLESVEIINTDDEFPFILNIHRLLHYLNLMDYRIRITYDSIHKAICLDQLKLDSPNQEIVLYTFRVPASLEIGRNYREPQLTECNVDFEFPPCWKIAPFVEYMGYYDKKKIMLSANNQGIFKLSSPEDEMSMEFVNCTNHQVNSQENPRSFASVVMDRQQLLTFLQSRGPKEDPKLDDIHCKIVDDEAIIFEGENNNIFFKYVMPLLNPY